MKLTVFNATVSAGSSLTANDFQTDLAQATTDGPTRNANTGYILSSAGYDILTNTTPRVIGVAGYMSTSGPPVLLAAGKCNRINTNPSTQSPPWALSLYNGTGFYLAWNRGSGWNVLAPGALVDCGQTVTINIVLYTKWGVLCPTKLTSKEVA